MENNKVDYVKKQIQTRVHNCHWPCCSKQVPPAMWGCKQHWFMLPREFRIRIWAHYRPGQEIDFQPNQAYLKVSNEIQQWINKNYF